MFNLNHPQRITNLKPFINQYNWKGINFPSHKEDWKKFESNNKSIALNILFVSYNTEKKDLHASQNIILSAKIKEFCWWLLMVCDDHDYCYVEMPDEFSKISKRNHREKLLKAPAIINADWECLLEKSYTEKKTNHTLSGCSMFASCSFDPTKNKLDCYKGEDCVEDL